MGIDYDSLFCLVDDFCKAFEPWYRKQLISNGKAKRNRECHLSLSEVLTILIAYHQSGMSRFKYFYFNSFSFHQELFPGLVHYTRFIKLIKRALPALVCLLKSLEGEITRPVAE